MTDNRVGLRATALRELPLGAVRPAGWLAEQLDLQASGLTGSLESMWPAVGPDLGPRPHRGDPRGQAASNRG